MRDRQRVVVTHDAEAVVAKLGGQVVQRLHCLPWEGATGLKWAELLARLRTAGKAMPIKDSLIAATALTHGLTIAT